MCPGINDSGDSSPAASTEESMTQNPTPNPTPTASNNDSGDCIANECCGCVIL